MPSIAAHMHLVFFVYGLAFFLCGFAIVLKRDTQSPHPLVATLPWLAAFGLLHGLGEWADMLLAVGPTAWTAAIATALGVGGLYLTVLSFVCLFAFGLVTVTPPPLRRGRMIVLLGAAAGGLVTMTITGIEVGFSPSWRATVNVLSRYALGLPGSLLTAAALMQQSGALDTRRQQSASLVWALRGLAGVFVAYALLAGAVGPRADFFPASRFNHGWFADVTGVPIQLVRMVAALAAAACVSGVLTLFSRTAYGTLTRLAHERAELLAAVNASLEDELVERRRVETELAEARDLALESARTKSEFLANMSHEIRTPMNGVIGMVDLALDTELTAEQQEYLATARDSAESLLMILNDILDFSKIEAGKLAVDVVEFDLEASFATTIKSLAPRAHHKGLELVYSIGPEVPGRLSGDPHRLRQVITNLIGNAIKFTDAGEVVLRIGVESRTATEIVLSFAISDTGIGIPLDKQDAIFTPFVQADGSMTRRYGGTGLGLAISSQLVGLLGGRLWLDSTPGAGSTFHFTARFGVAATAAPGPVPDAVSLAGVPVLVIDDNAVNRKILGALLERWGMRPTLAENGPMGLAALRAAQAVGGRFPLILLDAQMPDMDGFSVAEQIQGDAALADVMIMMLTSADRQGDAARGRSLGIATYLVKPVLHAALHEAVLVTLGIQARAAHTPDRTPVPRHRAGAQRVLVVEDNVVNQTVARRLLEKRGFDVMVAGTGREALHLLGESPEAFDLVLMDVQMPDMDGLEATVAIRRRERAAAGRRLPIIALTAHAMKGDRERFLAVGMDDYVSKPLSARELLAAIERVAPGMLAPVS